MSTNKNTDENTLLNRKYKQKLLKVKFAIYIRELDG